MGELKEKRMIVDSSSEKSESDLEKLGKLLSDSLKSFGESIKGSNTYNPNRG